MHAEHELLARLFVATAAAQVLIGALVLLRAGRLTAIGTALINGAAVVAWAVTRVADISWIGGLEQAEAPQFVDTACAALGVIATVAAVVALRPAERTVRTGSGIIAPAIAVAAVTVAAMLTTASHVHSHGESASRPRARDRGRHRRSRARYGGRDRHRDHRPCPWRRGSHCRGSDEPRR